VADLAIAKAKAAPQHLDLNWSSFLKMQPDKVKKAAPKRAAAKEASTGKKMRSPDPTPSSQ
jgi:hypothetical protein